LFILSSFFRAFGENKNEISVLANKQQQERERRTTNRGMGNDEMNRGEQNKRCARKSFRAVRVTCPGNECAAISGRGGQVAGSCCGATAEWRQHRVDDVVDVILSYFGVRTFELVPGPISWNADNKKVLMRQSGSLID